MIQHGFFLCRVVLACFAAFLSVCLSTPSWAVPAYKATVLLSESGHPPRPCGKVAISDSKARIDVDLGGAGLFQALVRPDLKVMYVVAEDLKAYVQIPIHGDETDIRELIKRVAESLMPFGVPVLVIREDAREIMGKDLWQGYEVLRTKSRFVADFMGTVNSMYLIISENADFAPFPLRVQEIRALDRPGDIRSSVDLIDIIPGSVSKAQFELPEGYARYSSVLDLLLYAIARQ